MVKLFLDVRCHWQWLSFWSSFERKWIIILSYDSFLEWTIFWCTLRVFRIKFANRYFLETFSILIYIGSLPNKKHRLELGMNVEEMVKEANFHHKHIEKAFTFLRSSDIDSHPSQWQIEIYFLTYYPNLKN